MKSFTFILILLFIIQSSYAQYYQISFAGTGVSTIVDSVKVENLAQGTSVSLLGSEILNLEVTTTGLNSIVNSDDDLRIFPNPMTTKSTINFFASTFGLANIELFDITGKRISFTQNIFPVGINSIQVSDLERGTYLIRISSQTYNYTGKLVCNGTSKSRVKLIYQGSHVVTDTFRLMKSVTSDKVMKYNTGDILKVTGMSNNYPTIITDVPNRSKTLIFTFVAGGDQWYDLTLVKPDPILSFQTLDSIIIEQKYDSIMKYSNYDETMTLRNYQLDLDKDGTIDLEFKDYHWFNYDIHYDYEVSMIGKNGTKLLFKDYVPSYSDMILFQEGDLINMKYQRDGITLVSTNKFIQGSTQGYIYYQNSGEYIGFISENKIGWIKLKFYKGELIYGLERRGCGVALVNWGYINSKDKLIKAGVVNY